MRNLKENKKDKESEEKYPRLWGIIYSLIGIDGLVFSVFTLIYSLGMVPQYGTITVGVLIGILSIIISIYGYRLFNKDY